MKITKKSQELVFKVIIFVALGVLVLSILVIIFSQNIGRVSKLLRLTEYEFCEEIYKQSLSSTYSPESRKYLLLYFFDIPPSSINIEVIGNGGKDETATEKVKKMKGKCKKYLIIFPEVEKIIKEPPSTPPSGTFTLVYAKIFLEI